MRDEENPFTPLPSNNISQRAIQAESTIAAAAAADKHRDTHSSILTQV